MLERALCPTLVGREEQLFALEDALLAAHRGESRFVALGGEAGMGKTRLATELAKRARRLDWEVLWGACSEAELPLPYLPLVEALGNYLSRQDVERLAGELGAARLELAQLFPQLGGAELPAPLGDPAQAKLRLFEAVVALLAVPAREHGLLLVVEDVHWAESATRELLDHLARRLTNVRSLVLVTYRSDELDRRHPVAPLLQTWRRSGLAELVSLSPLDRREIAEMIAAILDDEEIGPELRDLMHARTEGNPFVLDEMLKEAIDRGDVVGTGHGWETRSLGALRISETVRDTILLRFARLDPAEIEILRAAAVLGRTFDYATLVAVAGAPEETVHDALDVGVAQQLLEEVGGGRATYRWRHALTQEAVADEIVLPRRQQIHGRAADVLVEAGASPLEIARHLLGAARFDEAVPACVEAAEEAEASLAFAEALELLDRALPHVRDPLVRARLLCHMGRVLWTDGKTAAAEEVLEEGIPALEEAGKELEAARYRLVLARCHWEQSRPDRSHEEFERARRVLEERGPSAELSIAYMRIAGLYKFEFDDARSLGGLRARMGGIVGRARTPRHEPRRRGDAAARRVLRRGAPPRVLVHRAQHRLQRRLEPPAHDDAGRRQAGRGARVRAGAGGDDRHARGGPAGARAARGGRGGATRSLRARRAAGPRLRRDAADPAAARRRAPGRGGAARRCPGGRRCRTSASDGRRRYVLGRGAGPDPAGEGRRGGGPALPRARRAGSRGARLPARRMARADARGGGSGAGGLAGGRRARARRGRGRGGRGQRVADPRSRASRRWGARPRRSRARGGGLGTRRRRARARAHRRAPRDVDVRRRARLQCGDVRDRPRRPRRRPRRRRPNRRRRKRVRPRDDDEPRRAPAGGGGGRRDPPERRGAPAGRPPARRARPGGGRAGARAEGLRRSAAGVAASRRRDAVTLAELRHPIVLAPLAGGPVRRQRVRDRQPGGGRGSGARLRRAPARERGPLRRGRRRAALRRRRLGREAADARRREGRRCLVHLRLPGSRGDLHAPGRRLRSVGDSDGRR